MIIISGTFFIKADMREAAIASMLAMAKASQAEAGCDRYDFMADLEDPLKFYLYEEWESTDFLEAHGKSAHMLEFRKLIPEAVSAPPVVTYHSAEVITYP